MKKPIAVAILVLLAVGAIWWLTRDGDDGDGPGPVAPGMFSEAESRQLLELKNEALGHLENHEFAEAIALYDEMREALPDEPLVLNNLALAHVLDFEKSTNLQTPWSTEERDAAFAVSRAAIEDLAARLPDSPLPHYLAGKLAVLARDDAAATRAYFDAAEAAAADEKTARMAPALFYITAEASEPVYQDDDATQLGKDALRRAHELAPENVFIWSKWMIAQLENRDPGLRNTLADMRSQIAVLAPDIVARYPDDNPLDSLDSAVAALDANDWPAALGHVYGIRHIIKIHDAFRSDRDYRTNIHALDFVVEDFSPEFYKRCPDLESEPEASAVRFALAAEQLPIETESILDVRIADVDLDLRPDICVFSPGRVEVWSQFDKQRPDEWLLRSSAEAPEGYTGILLYDLDDDWNQSPRRPVRKSARRPGEKPVDDPNNCSAADPDLVLFGDAGVLLLENRWDRETDTRSWAVPTVPEALAEPWELPQIAGVRFATAADVDVDGDLDLIFGTDEGLRLWSNSNSFLFRDVTVHAQLPPDLATVTDAAGVDWDRDVDLDIVLCCADGTVGLLENLRHGTLRWRELAAMNAKSAESLAVVELDGNVSWDLVVGSTDGTEFVRTRTLYKGRLDVIEHAVADDAPAHRLLVWDFDNDAHEDLLCWNAEGLHCLRGLGSGKFAATPDVMEEFTVAGPLVTCRDGDLDQDGDLDLVVVDESGVRLLSNEGGNQNGWLEITLAAAGDTEMEGAQTRRVNHYGIGSTLELRAGPHFQAKVANGQVTHFGLGELPRADVVRVIWTNGFPEHTMRPDARQRICEVETPKGSCPFLYTWDGERFRFVTDMCWAAPLGLQSAQGGIIPCQDEEHILVPGEFLRPKDGRYVLQVTSELWEADYFDELELIAIDHPDDVSVFSNEKVSPPELNRFGIHTAGRKQTPRAAHNHVGRDLLPEIRERDDRYAQPFEQHLMQGYTDDSVLELDLGDVADPNNVKLFLTGWILPTDTTINVALAENPLLPGPQPPMLSVPDADGNWQTVYPSMGFPGGKTKTIVVDLSGRFLTDDYRVRIETSMELYWDEVFFTSGEAPAPTAMTRLTPLAADLHFRGFSRRIPRPDNAPADFDYDTVRTEPAWPTIEGPFTNYGDVLDRVNQSDDVVAALAPGDEMTVEFAVPDGPPPGWTRDFILRTVGWDKDADLHTICGQTAGPYPTRGASHYPATFDFGPSGENGRETDDLRFRRLLKLWRPGMELENP